MARVVQQRTSSVYTYLTVLFVFLFLAATAVAVFTFISRDKLAEENKKLVGMNKVWVGGRSDDAAYQKMLDDAKAPNGEPVVGQQQQRINRLTQLITGSEREPNPDGLVDDAYAAYKRINPNQGLVGLAPALIDADKVLAHERTLEAQLREEIKTLRDEVKQKTDQLARANAAAVKATEDHGKEIAKRDQAIKQAQDERGAAEKAMDEAKKKEVADLQKTISDNTTTILDQAKEIERQKVVIAGYEGKLRGPGVGPGPEPVRQANGAITKVADDVAYIDLGRKDRLPIGITFSVYPAAGIPQDPNLYKAKVVVTAVYDDFSACRIYMQREKSDPVLANDKILNVAYDRAKTFKFVVVGQFDLYRTARPSEQGAEEVRDLIRRFGGVIEKEVTPDTDYVVVGEEPPAPRPAAGTEADAAKTDMDKARKFYQDQISKALGWKIQVLNVNRFLNLVGYDPSLTGSQ